MSSARIQEYLDGVVEEAIETHKEAQEALRFEMGKLDQLRLQLRGTAASALDADQRDKLSAQHEYCVHAEEATVTTAKALERAMALVSKQEEGKEAVKATVSDVVMLGHLRNTSVMRELPLADPTMWTTLGGDNPDATRTLQEFAGYLTTPLSFAEREARETPQGQLRSALADQPHRSRIVEGETSAAYQDLMEPYVDSMQGLARKKSGVNSPKLDDDGQPVLDRGLQGDNLTRGGLQLLYDASQSMCKINLSPQGQLTRAMIMHCMAERMLSSAATFQLAGGRSPAVVSTIATWTATAAALQLAVTRSAHQSNSKESMAGTTATVLCDRHLAIIKAAFSAKRFQLHRVKTLAQVDGSLEPVTSSQAMLWGFEAYRRDRIKQETWIAQRLRTHVLQVLQENGATEAELRRAFVLFWRVRMHFKIAVLNAAHLLYSVEFIRKGTVANMLDTMLKIKPIETPLTGV